MNENYYVTNSFRNDGFGAQYQTIIYAAIASEIINKPFAYTPFSVMEHNYDNDPEFLNKKEKFINLIENFEKASDQENVKVLNFNSTRLMVESDITYNCERKIFKYIKNLFHNNKTSIFNKNHKHIAIHLRRINANDNEGCYSTHYESDKYYIDAINHLRNQASNIQPLFHLYSQGKEEEFQNFKSEDIILHLNEPLEDTFYNLTTADTLVMSKGSFSYVAGLLSKGEVYYLPFWHPKLNNWKTF